MAIRNPIDNPLSVPRRETQQRRTQSGGVLGGIQRVIDVGGKIVNTVNDVATRAGSNPFVQAAIGNQVANSLPTPRINERESYEAPDAIADNRPETNPSRNYELNAGAKDFLDQTTGYELRNLQSNATDQKRRSLGNLRSLDASGGGIGGARENMVQANTQDQREDILNRKAQSEQALLADQQGYDERQQAAGEDRFRADREFGSDQHDKNFLNAVRNGDTLNQFDLEKYKGRMSVISDTMAMLTEKNAMNQQGNITNPGDASNLASAVGSVLDLGADLWGGLKDIFTNGINLPGLGNVGMAGFLGWAGAATMGALALKDFFTRATKPDFWDTLNDEEKQMMRDYQAQSQKFLKGEAEDIFIKAQEGGVKKLDAFRDANRSGNPDQEQGDTTINRNETEAQLDLSRNGAKVNVNVPEEATPSVNDEMKVKDNQQAFVQDKLDKGEILSDNIIDQIAGTPSDQRREVYEDQAKRESGLTGQNVSTADVMERDIQTDDQKIMNDSIFDFGDGGADDWGEVAKSGWGGGNMSSVGFFLANNDISADKQDPERMSELAQNRQKLYDDYFKEHGRGNAIKL